MLKSPDLAHLFPVWSQNSAGGLQINVWTALRAAGLVGSLQVCRFARACDQLTMPALYPSFGQNRGCRTRIPGRPAELASERLPLSLHLPVSDACSPQPCCLLGLRPDHQVAGGKRHMNLSRIESGWLAPFRGLCRRGAKPPGE